MSVRRGLYVAIAPDTPRPESFLLANHVYGPSYVSMDSALSFYGMIPERVYEISSATTKTSRQFRTPAGTLLRRGPLPTHGFRCLTTHSDGSRKN